MCIYKTSQGRIDDKEILVVGHLWWVKEGGYQDILRLQTGSHHNKKSRPLLGMYLNRGSRRRMDWL